MTIEIPLTQGKVALIDDEDLALIAESKWQFSKTNGYAIGSRNGKTVTMHSQLIKVQQGFEVDHKDGNKLNNQKYNLRPATDQQQSRNRPMRSSNASGYKGVTWHVAGKKWTATIWNNRKQKYLGLFENASDAAKAYDNAAKELFGEFARLNFE